MLEETLGDQDVLALSRRVKLHLDPEFDAMFSASVPGRVTVTVRGRQLTETVLVPKGEPSNPMSWQDLERKFFAATRAAADPVWVADIPAAMRRFEDGAPAPLLKILRQKSAGTNPTHELAAQ